MMQGDRTIFFLTYFSTPVIFILGGVIMYFLIGTRPQFWGILGFYFVALLLLYLLKLGILRRMLRKTPAAAEAETSRESGEADIEQGR